jgi:hypothetical protein
MDVPTNTSIPQAGENQKPKHNSLRAPEDRAVRLRKVQRLKLVLGWPIQDIADEVGISYRQVQRDLIIIRKKMRATAQNNLEFEARDIAEDLKLAYEEKIKFLWNEYARLEGNGDSEKTRLARFGILKRITDVESAHLDHLRKLGIITSPDDNKPGVNIGFILGKPESKDGKETEDLERELAESVTILGGNKSSSINRL